MPRRSDTSLATLLLTARVVRSEVKPLTAREYWQVVGAVGDVADLLGCDEAHLRERVGADAAPRVAALLDRATAMALELERLEQAGVLTVAAVDAVYPARLRSVLGDQAPAVLHAAGPVDLLDRGGLGIVGSRDVQPLAAEFTRSAAEHAAVAGEVVVSGGARGADGIAMTAALAGGGEVVGVLADALVRTANDAEVRRAVADGRLCLVTPYAPTAPFSVGNAMGRNKVIYALADRTFVVACVEGSGGTWAGATEALRGGFGTVFAWTGEGAPAANHELVARGARAVSGVEGGPATPVPGSREASAMSDPQPGEQLGLFG